jgi:5-formyltetrahydrofolate cyclo-ligase
VDAKQLREMVRKRRDGMPERERLRKSDEVWKRLVELPAFQMASTALFYVSVSSEVETAMMRTLTRELGMTVACPRSKPGDKSMSFHVLASEDELSPGAYGILQPAAETPLADLKDAVVLVPGMAFDRQGHRLGFGGGYYDRWLAGPGQGLPTVALAFHEQVVESVPQEAHDIPIQWLVTDKETVDCSAAKR